MTRSATATTLVAATAAAVTALALVAGWAVTRPAADEPNGVTAVVHGERGAYVGTLLDPPPLRPALRLTDTTGRPFDLRRRPPGEVTVLFFGYTNCDDVCPTTMADLAAARRILPTDRRRHVTVVFVTEDPDRDIPRVLRTWLDRFDPAIVGLIGGNDTTEQVLDQLHLPPSLRYEATKPAPHTHAPGEAGKEHPHGGDGVHDNAEGYEVEHSGVVYAFGPRGRTLLYTGGTAPRQFAGDFTRLLRR